MTAPTPRPPTYAQASERGLIADEIAGRPTGIYTFSNGSHWDCWATPNCHRCRFYGDNAGEFCAFEAAAFLGAVTPGLARIFGWEQRETEYGPRQCWYPPDRCAFLSERGDDDDEPVIPPEPDPLQLVLLADPTEDAAGLVTGVDVPRETPRVEVRA